MLVGTVQQYNISRNALAAGSGRGSVSARKPAASALRLMHPRCLSNIIALSQFILAVFLIVFGAGSCFAIQTEPETGAKSYSAEAGPVKMTVTISKNKAAVADPVELNLSILAPDDVKVFLPQVPSHLGSLDVISHQEWPDLPSTNGRQWRQKLVLESIQTGELKIPAIEVGLSGNGDDDRIRSPEIPLTITSVLEDRADPAAFRDIRTVIDLPVPEKRSYAWIGWTAGFVVGAVALVALAIAVTRRRRWILPGGWAMQELISIRAELDQGKLSNSDGASGLSVTLRTFLEMQFGFSAASSTTDQVLDELRERDELKPELVDDLAGQLHQLDLITYAGLEPDKSELLKAVDAASSWVEQAMAPAASQDSASDSGGGA